MCTDYKMEETLNPVDICRTCGAEDGKIGIFSEEGLQMQLAKKINKYLPITVSVDDEFPLALCPVCIDRLESCHQLVVSCLDTHERFRQLNSSNLDCEDLKTSQVYENVNDRLHDMFNLPEENVATGLAGKVLAHRLDLSSDGLVAPNVYVIPSLNSSNNDSKKTDDNTESSDDHLHGFFCEGCNVSFKLRDKFVKHQLHCPLIKEYICVVCEYETRHKDELISHIDTHETLSKINSPPQHVCEVCKRVLSTKTSLKLHLRTHSGEKPYNCKLCGKAFAQKSALHYHEKTHNFAKPFHCRFCGKGFNGKLVLQTHERIHTGERPFLCPICNARFRCLANLRQHELIHTDNKPFQCPVCCKTFRRPEKVRIHLRIHTGEKPYPCPTCGRRFTQKGDMMKHKAIHKRIIIETDKTFEKFKFNNFN